jgi:hypothetical protein
MPMQQGKPEAAAVTKPVQGTMAGNAAEAAGKTPQEAIASAMAALDDARRFVSVIDSAFSEKAGGHAGR